MLLEQYPGQIKAMTRFIPNKGGSGGVALRHGDTVFYWERSYFADPNVFEIFPPTRVLYGDPKTAMNEIGSLAISETFARKYFGNANPIGEIIATDAGIPQHVTLVFADQPANTHLKYDVLFSTAGIGGIVGDTKDGAAQRQLL
jgi:putative ABC transport system permease protein